MQEARGKEPDDEGTILLTSTDQYMAWYGIDLRVRVQVRVHARLCMVNYGYYFGSITVRRTGTPASIYNTFLYVLRYINTNYSFYGYLYIAIYGSCTTYVPSLALYKIHYKIRMQPSRTTCFRLHKVNQ